MSGLEILGAVAAAAHLTEQGLKIVNLYSKIRDAPESISKHIVHIERLIEVAKLVEKNQPLQTAPIEVTLRQCLAKATTLLETLSKMCVDTRDGKVIKWKKAIAGVAKEKEIITLFAEIEREKSSLSLCISTVDSKLLGTIHLDLDTVKTLIEDVSREQAQNHIRDRERKVRIWLRPSAFEDEHKRRQRERVNGTNTWFLEHHSFKEWSNPNLPSDSSRLLWAYGKPGCGKSMLASSIVLHLQNLGYRPLYFFSNSKLGNAVESSPLGLVRTLLVQCLDANPQLVDSLFTQYTKSNTEEASSFDELWETFGMWCYRQSSPIFCVIDALDEAIDECSDPEDFLASFVDTMNRYPMVRVCVTSRPNSRIKRHFLPETDIDDVSAQGEDAFTQASSNIAATGKSCVSRIIVSEDQVGSDVRAYIKVKVNQSRKLKIWLGPAEIDTLCARAEGMFLWARLMFDDLQKAPTRGALEGKLVKAPKGLMNLYALITKRFSETLDEDQLLLCRRVLQWIITTKEHLTVDKLAVALAIQEGQKVLDQADVMFDPQEEIMAVCAPLVEIADQTVRIVHLSVKDFLLDSSRTNGQDGFAFSKDSLNADLGISLLTLLSFDDFSAASTSYDSDDQIEKQNQSFGARSSTSVSDEAGDQSDDENESSQASWLLQYGLDNWHHHCVESEVSENAPCLYQLVCNYLKSDNSFLWMRNLAVHNFYVDWIHIENQLLEWGRKLNAGEETALRRGFVHGIAARRMAHLKKDLGGSNPRTLDAMDDLATIWQNQGRWKEAEELGVQVLEVRKRVLGQEHPDTLTDMGNLANTYWKQERWEEAEELDVQVLEMEKRVLGQEHLGTLISMGNLASTYWKQERWEEAEQLQVQVFEMRKRVLGQEHPDTLWSMNHLACTWKSLGRDKEAIALMRQVERGCREVLGVAHPHTKDSRDGLEIWEIAFNFQESGFSAEAFTLGMEDEDPEVQGED